MGYSDFRPGFKQNRTIKSGSGVSTAGNNVITLELEKALITAEHALHITVSQPRTTAATSSDTRKVIKSAELKLLGGRKDGTRFSLSGYQLAMLSRITENQPAPVVSLANGTATFVEEIHHVIAGSRSDMLSALRAGEYEGISLVITLNLTADQMFAGGTAAGDVTVNIKVKAKDYPAIKQMQNAEKIGTFAQFAIGKSYNTNGVGEQADFLMPCPEGRLHRFVLFSAFDAAGAPSDAEIGKIELKVGNYQYDTTFTELRAENASSLAYDVVGSAVIDFGPDPVNWLPEGIKDSAIKWVSLVAGGRVEVCPVYIEPLSK